jgi:hypothetical protein
MEGSTGSPFDTDNAFDGEYKNLERRCFKESVDYEESTTSSIRLRDWQVLAINTVKNKSGSNQTQVLYSAYLEGLSVVRSVIDRERIKDLGEINELLVKLSTDYTNYQTEQDELYSNALGDEITDPLRHHGKCGDTFTFVCKDSAKSEIKDTFEADSKFGPWIHRSIISLGLDSSDTIGRTLVDNVYEVKRAVSGMYDKSRSQTEGSLKNIITNNYQYWLDNGMLREQLDDFRKSVGLMETHHKSVCEITLDEVEENAEVIEA